MDDLVFLIINDVPIQKYFPHYITESFLPTGLLKELVLKRNEQGQTPIYLAFRRANIELVIILMNAGAKCDMRNSDGSTPYMGYHYTRKNKEISEEKLKLFKKNIIDNMSHHYKSAKRLYLDNSTIKIESFLSCPSKNNLTPSMIHKEIAIFTDTMGNPFAKDVGVSPLRGKKGAYLFDHSDCMLQCYDSHMNFQFQSKLILETIDTNVSFFLGYISTKNVPLIYDGEISTEIGNPNNNHHYFVLPSQLNGAEYPSHDTIVENISEYQNDRTGGPIGQLSVHHSIGQFIIDNAANDNNPNGINGVKFLTSPDIKSINGYLKVSQSISKSAVKQFKNDIYKLVMIGMEQCPVKNHTHQSATRLESASRSYTVNLIYASAVPMSCYVNPYTNDNLTEIANTILVAEYFGALQVAFKRGLGLKIKQCIHLMPLGGGVFRNKQIDIMRSILIAIYYLEQKYGADDVSHFLEIRMLCYYKTDEKNVYNGLFRGSHIRA